MEFGNIVCRRIKCAHLVAIFGMLATFLVTSTARTDGSEYYLLYVDMFPLIILI